MPYKAFISYSHAADDQFAPALQSALHQFARPFYMPRAVKVFRDKTDLSANPALWPVIQKALDESEYFLLLASPQAARSKWVKREINHWLDRHQGAMDKLLIMWTDGKMVWDAEAGDFNWQETDALPSLLSWDEDDESPTSLEKRFKDEPFYLDERWTRTEKDISLRNPRFLDDVATLAATLHGKTKSDMIGEDVKRHRKYRRVRNSVIVLLSVLLVASVAAAIVAEINRREAVRQTQEAIRQAQVALSRQLAMQSAAYSSSQLDLALLLAINAYNIKPTVEARSSLLGALKTSPHLVSFLHGHNNVVNSVDFSPDDKTLVSGGQDQQIIFWDTSSHTPVDTLRADGSVNLVAFSPSGKLLVSGGVDGSFTVWDAVTRKPILQRTLFEATRRRRLEGGIIETTGDSGSVKAVAYSSDESQMVLLSDATGEDAKVTLWDLATGNKLGFYKLAANETPDLNGSWGITSAAFLKPSGKLAAFSEFGVLMIWDNVKARPRASTLYDPMSGFAPATATFSHDGQLMAVANNEGGVDIWNTMDGARAKPRKIGVRLSGPVGRLAFSRDKKILAAGVAQRIITSRLLNNASSGEIALLDVDKGEVMAARMPGHGRDVASIAFNHKGDMLASGSYDRKIILWNKEARPPIERLLAESREGLMGRNTNLLINISVSPDGQKVAACNSSGKAVVWSTAGGEVLERLPGGKSRSAEITFTDSNKVLVLASDGKSLTLSGEISRSLELETDPTKDEAPPPRVFTLAFTLSADGKVVAVRDSKENLSFFDLPSLTAKRAAQAALPEHLSLATLSDDGKLLAAYKRDERSVVVLSAETGEQQNVLQLNDAEPNRLAFSHDAKRVAIGMKSDRLIVWHLSTSQQLDRAITGDPATLVRSLAFNADNQTLAVGTMFGGVVLFDLASGRALVESLGQRDVVQNLVFSADGKQLVASYPDGSVVLWDINIDSWIGQARDIANRGLSDDEYQQYVSNP